MNKAINLERVGGGRVQINAEDIQFVEENDGKANIMIRWYGQMTVAHDFEDVIRWLDQLWGRQHIAEVVVEEPATDNDDPAWKAHEENEALALHTEDSRNAFKKMMMPKKPKEPQ